MSNFADQKPHTATIDHINAPWGGISGGRRFRCYLCGHKFKVGDVFRWVFCGDVHLTNMLVCQSCDSPDVKEKWKTMHDEAENKFWWFVEKD